MQQPQQPQIPNYIRAFIHPQNQTLLWKIVVENNPQWTAGLFKNNADATANWFRFIIQQTYELEIIAAKTQPPPQTTTTTTTTLYSDLKQLNQKFLQSIASDLQKHFQQPSQQQQMQYQQQQNNPAVIKQENMFELEKYTPLPNLEELMQQQMKQRDEIIIQQPQQQQT